MHELLGLVRLAPPLPAQGERKTDDDLLCSLLSNDLAQSRQPVRRRRTLDDRERPGDRPRFVRDRDAGARGAVIEREDLHSALRISRSASANASGSFSGSLPPARAIVGRPPPPPPTIAAA